MASNPDFDRDEAVGKIGGLPPPLPPSPCDCDTDPIAGLRSRKRHTNSSIEPSSLVFSGPRRWIETPLRVSYSFVLPRGSARRRSSTKSSMLRTARIAIRRDDHGLRAPRPGCGRLRIDFDFDLGFGFGFGDSERDGEACA